jgi:hypothetical protein
MVMVGFLWINMIENQNFPTTSNKFPTEHQGKKRVSLGADQRLQTDGQT